MPPPTNLHADIMAACNAACGAFSKPSSRLTDLRTFQVCLWHHSVSPRLCALGLTEWCL
jgi:hypothetical protein